MTDREMNIKLSREECLACLVALEREKKPYGWQQQAIKKLDKARMESGYCFPPKLELIGDERINSAFDSAFDKPMNFDHKPTPDEIIAVRLRAVANNQLAADQKAIEGVKDESCNE